MLRSACLRSIRCLFLGLAWATSAFAFQADEKSASKSLSQEEEKELRAIAEAYQANRAKFKQFLLRWTHRVGTSDTEADALIGKLSEVTATTEVKWAFDGSRSCFIEESPDGSVDKITQEAFANAKLANGGDVVVAMSQGIEFHTKNVAFNYSPGAATFFSPFSDTPQVSDTPFDLRFMGPGEKASPDKVILGEFKSHSPATMKSFSENGSPRVQISYDLSKEWRVECVLDPKQGHMIRRATITSPRSTVDHIHVISARQCANGGWIPEHAVNYHTDNGKSHVHEWRIIDVKCDGLADSDFEVTLPKGIQINSPRTPDAAFNLEEDMRVGEAEAIELMARANKRARR